MSNVRSRFWAKLLELAGYPKNYARLHDLRGTNTDLAAILGLPIAFSQEQLGHASPTTTLKSYNQANTTIRQNSVKEFEKIFGKHEQNVSIKGKIKNNNLILFPRKASSV